MLRKLCRSICLPIGYAIKYVKQLLQQKNHDKNSNNEKVKLTIYDLKVDNKIATIESAQIIRQEIALRHEEKEDVSEQQEPANMVEPQENNQKQDEKLRNELRLMEEELIKRDKELAFLKEQLKKREEQLEIEIQRKEKGILRFKTALGEDNGK